MRHPKFEERIKDEIIHKETKQSVRSTYGIVSNVNIRKNTVDVWLAAPDSDEFSEVLFNVPYPIMPGIQMAAPPVGTPCWVDFKGNDYSTPIVTHFFNHVFLETQSERHNTAVNEVPRYMYGM